MDKLRCQSNSQTYFMFEHNLINEILSKICRTVLVSGVDQYCILPLISLIIHSEVIHFRLFQNGYVADSPSLSDRQFVCVKFALLRFMLISNFFGVFAVLPRERHFYTLLASIYLLSTYVRCKTDDNETL